MGDGERSGSPPAAKRHKSTHDSAGAPTTLTPPLIAERLNLRYCERHGPQAVSHLAALLGSHPSITDDDGLDCFADLVTNIAEQLASALKTQPSDVGAHSGDAPMLATVLERCNGQLLRFSPLARAFRQDSRTLPSSLRSRAARALVSRHLKGTRLHTRGVAT